MAGQITGQAAAKLLGPDDPVPYIVDNAGGRSPFLLIGDHAGSAIPRSLGDLGLSAADRSRHIAVDIGVLGLGKQLAHMLDATFIHQAYSRLVIDCNRDPEREDAIPAFSDGSRIAGNDGLDDVGRMARTEAIHTVYHEAISTEIKRRQAEGRDTIILALHSFTPILNGFIRPWHVGILHWLGRSDFAKAMFSALQTEEAICVGDNQPYRMDATDYSIAFHAIPQNLSYAEIEIKQDLISHDMGQVKWAACIHRAANAALSQPDS